MYRGELFSAEDNWNMTLRNVLATARDGRQSNLETIFLRGSRIRFVTVPDMLKHAPMFKRLDPKYSKKGFGMGVGNVRAQPTRLRDIPELATHLRWHIGGRREPQMRIGRLPRRLTMTAPLLLQASAAVAKIRTKMQTR